MQCPYCGLTYEDFKTGFTYRDIYYMIYDRQWKRRNGVLGYWRQIKKEMFEQHIIECEKERKDVRWDDTTKRRM